MPDEARRSSFAHRTDPFAEVVCALQAILLGALVCHRRAQLLDERSAHRLADGSRRERPGRRDLCRVCSCSRPKLVCADEDVAQPQLARGRSIDPSACVQEVHRGLMTDDQRQCDGQTEAVMEAEEREVRREPRVRSGDPEVGGQRETEAASDGCALHRSDDGQRLLEQADRDVVEMRRALATNCA